MPIPNPLHPYNPINPDSNKKNKKKSEDSHLPPDFFLFELGLIGL